MIKASRLSYLRSLSSELDVQANRIRELIGSRHWLSDGVHKEALLGGLLSRHIPAGHMISKGFVTSESDPDSCSREQDLLIVDTATEAPAFAQNGLLIAFPQQVRAAISVKSQYSRGTLSRALTELASVAAASPPTFSDELWLGLFFFSTNPEPQTLSEPLEAIRQVIPTIERRAAIAEFVIRINTDVIVRCTPSRPPSRALAHRAQGLAASCFLARLLAWLAAKRNGNSSFEALLADVDVAPADSEELDVD